MSLGFTGGRRAHSSCEFCQRRGGPRARRGREWPDPLSWCCPPLPSALCSGQHARTHTRMHIHTHACTRTHMHAHSYRKGTGSSWPSCTAASPGATGEPSVKAADLLGLGHGPDTTVLKAPLFQTWAAQGGHPNWVRAIANSAPHFTEPTGLLTPGRQLRRADTVTRGGTWLQIPQK